MRKVIITQKIHANAVYELDKNVSTEKRLTIGFLFVLTIIRSHKIYTANRTQGCRILKCDSFLTPTRRSHDRTHVQRLHWRRSGKSIRKPKFVKNTGAAIMGPEETNIGSPTFRTHCRTDLCKLPWELDTFSTILTASKRPESPTCVNLFSHNPCALRWFSVTFRVIRKPVLDFRF